MRKPRGRCAVPASRSAPGRARHRRTAGAAPRLVVGACSTALALLGACSSFDLEGMSLITPLDAIVIGDTVRLSMVARDGTVPPASAIVWASTDTAVATVDELGLVTGRGRGVAGIEARTGDYTLRLPILVWETAGPFIAIEAGADHNCALTADGRAWCWGRDEDGQLGLGAFFDLCPVPGGGFLRCAVGALAVDTEERFTQLAVGVYHGCGLSTDGTAHCWGLNDRGQLGDGGTERGTTPAPVGGGRRFAYLAAGGRTTCGIDMDEALLCWGDGSAGVNGTTTDTLTTPTHVAIAYRFVRVATSGFHTCGVTRAGTTQCWGSNTFGELGVASVDSTCGSSGCTREPQEVSTAPPLVELALGRGFSCGLTAEGTAYCWGWNGSGQLGDGTRADRWQAMPVAGGHAFTRLAAGGSHACGVDGAGLLHCWGSDASAFGNGGDPAEAEEPVPAAVGLSFTAITIGFDTQCGVARSGVSWCWGGNLDGALGNGRTDPSTQTTPTRVIRHPAR